jgi:hypothetical protein
MFPPFFASATRVSAMISSTWSWMENSEGTPLASYGPPGQVSASRRLGRRHGVGGWQTSMPTAVIASSLILAWPRFLEDPWKNEIDCPATSMFACVVKNRRLPSRMVPRWPTFGPRLAAVSPFIGLFLSNGRRAHFPKSWYRDPVAGC